jgi:hypothetical protein
VEVAIRTVNTPVDEYVRRPNIPTSLVYVPKNADSTTTGTTLNLISSVAARRASSSADMMTKKMNVHEGNAELLFICYKYLAAQDNLRAQLLKPS